MLRWEKPSARSFEILALPESAAAKVVAGGINTVPSSVVAAGRQAAKTVLSEANQASTFTAGATPAPTLLDVLGLPLASAFLIATGLNNFPDKGAPLFPRPTPRCTRWQTASSESPVFRSRSPAWR